MSGPAIRRISCNGRSFYLLSRDADGGLDVLVTDASRAWRGHVSKESLQNSEKHEDIADYELQTRKALTGDGDDGFEFEMKEGGDKSTQTLRLVWKKVIEEDQIKFQLGSIPLEPVAEFSDALASIFDRVIASQRTLTQQVASLNAECERLTIERSDAVQKLEECVSIKEETEKNLYAKFAVVLNDKKAKLRHLKAQLEAAEMGTSSHIVDQEKQEKRAAKIRALVDAGERQAASAAATSTAAATTSSTDNHVKDDKKDKDNSQSSDPGEELGSSGDKSSGHVLDFLLEDSTAASDDKIPAGPKRSKPTASDGGDKPTDTSDYWDRVPRVRLTTGTTDTHTTSSDRIRWEEKKSRQDQSSDKNQADTGKDSSHQSKQTSSKSAAESKSADIDELIGDMA